MRIQARISVVDDSLCPGDDDVNRCVEIESVSSTPLEFINREGGIVTIKFPHPERTVTVSLEELKRAIEAVS